MSAAHSELITNLLHERPGGQGIGQGCQRAALVEAGGGPNLMLLATDIPPNVSGRRRVPSVEAVSYTHLRAHETSAHL
eukprot:4222788-Alexandrium_andersonii.AAC.1